MKYLLIILGIVMSVAACPSIDTVTTASETTTTEEITTASTTTTDPTSTDVPTTTAILEEPTCGFQNVHGSIQKRIKGGQTAAPGSIPWQAAIFFLGGLTSAGVLVADKWVLSTSVSLGGLNLEQQGTIYLGLNNMTDRESDPSVAVNAVKNRIEFTEINTIYPIFLLELTNPVNFTDDIFPICLPDRAADFEGQTLTASGWGLTQDSSSFPNENLLKVDVTVVPDARCQANNTLFDPTVHFCIEGNGTGPCSGDGGGPLTYYNSTTNLYHLAGLIADGAQCENDYATGVKVTNLVDWINSHISPTI